MHYNITGCSKAFAGKRDSRHEKAGCISCYGSAGSFLCTQASCKEIGRNSVQIAEFNVIMKIIERKRISF